MPLILHIEVDMVREDFERRGWELQYEYLNTLHFIKGDTWGDNGKGAFLIVKDETNVTITTTDEGFTQDGPRSSVKFKGICLDMDEFDMICRMIQLKI